MMEIIKLRQLKLPETANSPNGADNIIREVSEKTGAEIFWEDGRPPPCRRDACIKISGNVEAVTKAKEMLLQTMEMRSNRVVMKMDVTHLEHSSLIGRGGRLIKRVMEATGCHIHFPDGNMGSGSIKSNKVSISGQPLNVEKARIMIRSLIPVQMFFDVPSSSCFQPILASSPPENKLLESCFGLLIYSIQRKNGIVTIVIRCSQGQFSTYRQDILMLMEMICGNRGSDLPPVHVITDIMPQHHNFVKGNKGSNVQDIMKRTGAKIIFPDMNVKLTEKSSVKITGNLDCVYMAWQEIMNFLPLCLTFDINETRETKDEYMEVLLDCDVTVITRPKSEFHVKCVSVKGPEKFSKLMLQYRQHLLHLQTLNFNPDVDDVKLALSFLDSPSEFSHVSIDNISTFILTALPTDIRCQALEGPPNTSNNSSVVENSLKREQILAVPGSSVLSSSVGNLADSKPSEGFYSPTKPSIPSLDSNCRVEVNRKSSEVYACCRQVKGVGSDINSKSSLKFSAWEHSLSTEEVNSDHNEQVKQHSTLYIDYYRKKVLAAKAMRRPIESEESTQVPSNLWAGYGFSQSMPAPVAKENFETLNRYSLASLESNNINSPDGMNSWQDVLKGYSEDRVWSNKDGRIFSHSNYVDYMRDALISLNYPNKDILPELLWQHGLQKYIDIFTKEEIDYQTFLLLTDEELQMLGIGFPARMKIVWLIRELQDTEFLKMKTFDATPGAGRKSESFHSYNGKFENGL